MHLKTSYFSPRCGSLQREHRGDVPHSSDIKIASETVFQHFGGFTFKHLTVINRIAHFSLHTGIRNKLKRKAVL